MSKRSKLLVLLSIIVVIVKSQSSCTSNAMCNGNRVCFNNECIKCESHSVCAQAIPQNPYCENKICKECLQTSHCTSPTKPLCLNNVCTTCTDNTQCSHMGNGKNKCYSEQCVECYDNSHCTSGSCNLATKTCQGTPCTVGGTECSSTSTTPVCSNGFCRGCAANSNFCSSVFSNYVCSTDGSCKQCLNNQHCTTVSLSQCSNSICAICSADSHCSHISGKNKCDPSQGCVQCRSSSDCSNNLLCLDNICSTCTSDSQCSSIPGSKNKCDNGQCVECYENSHCSSGPCNMATKKCQSVVCSIGGNQCSSSSTTPVCSNGYCNGCEVDSNFCSSVLGNQVCSPDGSCKQCLSNQHCTSPNLSQCSNNICSICSSDSHCSHINGKNKCDSTRGCVECKFSSDCSGNYYCSTNGSCKQCLTNQHCLVPTLSQCLDNICSMCTDDSHCSHISGKNKCDSTRGCVECKSTSDCSPGSSCINSLCIPSPTPLLIKCQATEEPDTYTIQFPQELVNNTKPENGIFIKLLDIDPTLYSYSLVKLSETTYQVRFKVTKTIPSSKLQLNYTYYSLGGRNIKPPSWSVEISSKRIPFINEEQKQISQTMKAVGQVTTVAMAATSGSIIILGGNPAVLWGLIGLVQAFHYLMFVNVNYPANVQFFFKIFSFAKFDFIPNPIAWFIPDIEEMYLSSPARFEEYNVHGLFLDNAGNMLLVWFCVFSIYVISFLTLKYLNRLSRILTQVSSKVLLYLEWSGVLRAVIISYPKIILASFLQVREMSSGSMIFFASSLLAVVFAVFGFVFPVTTYMLVKQTNENKSLLHRKYASLVCEYKTEGYPKYFTSIFLLRRLMINFVLVFLHNWPYMEITLLLAVSILTILSYVKFKPYATDFENKSHIIAEILFLIVLLLIFVLIYDDIALKYSEEYRLDIGWGLMGLCALIVLINLILTIFEQIKTFKRLWKLFKAVLSKRPKREKRLAYIQNPRLSIASNVVTESSDSFVIPNSTSYTINTNILEKSIFSRYKRRGTRRSIIDSSHLGNLPDIECRTEL